MTLKPALLFLVGVHFFYMETIDKKTQFGTKEIIIFTFLSQLKVFHAEEKKKTKFQGIKMPFASTYIWSLNLLFVFQTI